jgi:hypothetical protein
MYYIVKFLFCQGEFYKIYGLFFYFFDHVEGEKHNSKGNISSLPRSIAALKTSFENTENPERLEFNPISPKTGPILLKLETAAVKLVSISYLSKLRRRNTERKQKA